MALIEPIKIGKISGAIKNAASNVVNTVKSKTPENAPKTVFGSSSGSSSGSSFGSSLAGVGSDLYASLQKDFQKSEKLTAAESYLEELTKTGYQSQYADEIAALTDQYLNRGPFKYDMNSDALFRVARDQATQSGKMAMQDTVANASSLTGGYGNSWAATAGNQAFQAYLTELYNNVPEYAQKAYDQYAQEGADMLNKTSLLMDQDETAYSRWMQDYLNHYNAAQDLYSQEYGIYSDDLSRNFNLAQMQNSDYWSDQENKRAWANYQLSKDKFAYDKEMDALALSASESGSDYKTPTDVMFDGALSAYNSGGENALLTFVEKYPEYDSVALYDYAINNGRSLSSGLSSLAYGGLTFLEDGWDKIKSAYSSAVAEEKARRNQFKEKFLGGF